MSKIPSVSIVTRVEGYQGSRWFLKLLNSQEWKDIMAVESCVDSDCYSDTNNINNFTNLKEVEHGNHQGKTFTN